MKIVDIREVWKYDIAVSGISVIRQTPVWNYITCTYREMNGFLLIDEGSLFYQWRDGAEEMNHGKLIYLPTGSVHRCDRREGAVSYYRINFIMTDRADGEQVIFSEGPMVMARNPGNTQFTLCGEMAESCLSNRSFLTFSLFGAFMDGLLQTMTGTGGRIRQAVDSISAHYTEETDPDRLARECFLSKAQFFRLFRAETGMTPLEYRNRLRIEKAKKLIGEGGCSMSEIAGILGFGSVYYFSRVFRSEVGVSPTQYARQRET